MSHTIIIVPSQGRNAQQFEGIARLLKRNVYRNNATIVKTTVGPAVPEGSMILCNATACHVDLNTRSGSRFRWSDYSGLTSVLTITHGGSDGPNLASLAGGHQPWGRDRFSHIILSVMGQVFWLNVANSLAPNGKVILLGCMMGGGRYSYADRVAHIVHRPVYASDNSFAAANRDSVLTHVFTIERGSVRPPMRRYLP